MVTNKSITLDELRIEVANNQNPHKLFWLFRYDNPSSNPIWYFVICPGFTEKGFYRQCTSRELTRKFSKNASYKRNNLPYYSCKNDVEGTIREWDYQIETMKKYDIEYKEVFYPQTLIRIESIFEFYKLIGYDYKSKKYIRNTL